MTDQQASHLEQLLQALSPYLVAALLGVTLYVVVPAISAANSISTIIQRQDRMEALYEQRYQAAVAQEKYYAARLEELTKLGVRIEHQEKRLDRIEDHERPRKSGKP